MSNEDQKLNLAMHFPYFPGKKRSGILAKNIFIASDYFAKLPIFKLHHFACACAPRLCAHKGFLFDAPIKAAVYAQCL